MSFRQLSGTPKCTVGKEAIELQFQEAETNGPELSAGGYLIRKIGSKQKQL